MSELVRTELQKMIVRKQRKIDSLQKEQDMARDEMRSLAIQRKALEGEVEELTAHLDELGGPVVVEAKE